jgi:sporulation protein YlmC with PRC-barrel domain
MLRSIKQLEGSTLGASDGEIGHVKDFYFDDKKWAIRYVVVETGTWLTGRAVLISPHAFGRLHQTEKSLRVKLTRKQIENSPLIDTHKPVSRQYEEEYHRYYGWPYYWQGDALWGMSSVPMMELPPTSAPAKSADAKGAQHNEAAAHLRSANAVNGYHIKTSDGTIGHVCDFMMDDENWAIAQIIVKTGHRFSGKEVQIPTGKVERISYDESTVFVNLTSSAVEKSPTHSMILVGMPALTLSSRLSIYVTP